jgi:hypothetical protein
MQLADSLLSTHHLPYMPDNWKFTVLIYLFVDTVSTSDGKDKMIGEQ